MKSLFYQIFLNSHLFLYLFFVYIFTSLVTSCYYLVGQPDIWLETSMKN